jgi:hypothetical protein
MAARTHRFTYSVSGSPASADAVTLYVTRDADDAEMLGTADSPLTPTEVSTGVYELASGDIYQAGEFYTEHWGVTVAGGGSSFETAQPFTPDAAAAPDEEPTWTYANWITQATSALKLTALDNHIAEVSEKIAADTSADGLAASHGTLQRYLEHLHKQRELWERRVSGSPSARRRVRGRFR